MGKDTKNFRQSSKSRSGDMGARNYSRISRMGSWYGKMAGLIKVRGKGGLGS